MSYSVKFITQEKVAPTEIFSKIVETGEKIMVISDEFPCIKFGVIELSLRGIEINQEENGYEVRICACSSLVDYYLFVKTVVVLKELTNVLGCTVEDEYIDNPYTKFNEGWIEREMVAGWNAVRALIKFSGRPVIMQGMFESFCVGPKMLNNENISLYPPYEDDKEKWERLTTYLTIIQWGLSDMKSTRSSLAINDNEGNPLGISMIYIENNQVQKFDYISFAQLMGFLNVDTEELLLIRFEDLRKVVHLTEYDTSFSSFDECQLRICPDRNSEGIISMEEINNIIATAQRYKLDEVVSYPKEPGSGYDECQKTFIFIWNPDRAEITLEDYINDMQDFYIGHFERKIHEWKEAKMDDRFYVVKVGDGNIGIVMAGVLGSHPYVASDWSGKGKKPYVVELNPSFMINPETASMLTTKMLEEAIPNFMWRGGYSGRVLDKVQAETLEEVFSAYLETIQGNDDGVNICIKEI